MYDNIDNKQFSMENMKSIVENGFSILNSVGKIPKITNGYDRNSFVNIMPIFYKNIVFTKYVTRASEDTHSAYIVSDRKSGKINHIFKSDMLSHFRTVFVAEYTLRKYIKKNEFKTVTLIGYYGKIMTILVDRIKDLFIDKDVIYLSKKSSTSEWNRGVNADVIISAPRYLENPISNKKSVNNNKLVIAIHSRGWHDGIDNAFDNVYTDNIQQTHKWIRKDAIEWHPKALIIKPGNKIFYNYGHVAFDLALYMFLLNKK